ncbi:MAG TPA: hypothetical protein VN673_12545 [Clostridia bacterium]|nr:hypothetical protein [Clostridia bacterium]
MPCQAQNRNESRRPALPMAAARSLLCFWLGCLLGSLLLPRPASAANEFVLYASGQYWEAHKAYQTEPTNATAAWRFGKACFDLAEFSTNSTERALLADQGIAACRRLLAREPDSVQGHYYLGLNLGQLARTKGLGALKIVDVMEREFLRVRELDPRFEHAGADRTLGLLYRDTPALGSIGSRSKARHHLQNAVELAPNFPENRLNLIESYLKWGDRNGARRELKALDTLLPEARKSFTGPAWADNWADWNDRHAQVRHRVENPQRGFFSPRDE